GTKYLLGWKFYFEGVAESRHCRPNLPLANNFFYEVWFPSALVLQLVVQDSEWFWLLPLQVGLFFKNYLSLWCDLRPLPGSLWHGLRSLHAAIREFVCFSVVRRLPPLRRWLQHIRGRS